MSNIETYTATDARKKFSDIYNKVRYSGEPVIITNHGDDSVIMLRTKDVYTPPTTREMFLASIASNAFPDLGNEESYE